MRDGFAFVPGRKRLGVLLVLLAVLPALAIGFVGYNFISDYLRSDRMEDVGQVAETKHNQLVMVLKREDDGAASLLSHLGTQCGGAKLNKDCAARLIRSYTNSERALGAALLENGRTDVTIGVSALWDGKNPMKRGQLAQLAGAGPDHNHSYFVSATEPSTGRRLTVTYPTSNLQPVFERVAELGESGEAFLADAEGYFVTQARYQPVAGHGHEHPISLAPMRKCLGGTGGELMDMGYRDAEIIHGFRPVPEIGSGCIMAHIDRAEALAPLVALERKAAGILLIFLVPVILAALYVARRIAKSEESLRASEAKFRMLFDSASDSFTVLDLQGRIVDVNRVGHERLGYAKEEMVGKSISQFNAPESAGKVGARLSELQDKGRVVTEAAHLRADGSVLPVEVNSRLVELDGQQRVFSIVRDISERKRMDEALRLTQFALDNLSMNVAMMRVDDGRFVYVNDAACRNFGFTRAELLGMTVFEVDPEFSPSRWAELNRELRQGGARTLETTHVTPDGRVCPVEVTANVLEIAGQEIHVGFAQEITERKQAEASLRESESKFRVLFESASDCLMLLDLQGNILDINRVGHERLGYTREEMVGKCVKEFDPPEFAARASGRFAEIRDKGQVIFESAHVRRNGSVMPIEINARLVELDGRQQLFSIVRDITERRQAESALRASENKFHILFEAANDCLMVVDLQGTILDVNRTGHERLGYTKAELVGKTIAQLVPPEVSARVPARLAGMQAQGHALFESVMLRRDGSVMAVEVNTSVIELEGQQKIFSVIRDITQRKEVEEQFKLLIHASLDGFWFTDMRGRFLEVNDGYCQLTGYSREELLGMSIPDVEANETPEETARHIEYLMKYGSHRFETRHRAKDGRILDIEVGVTHTANYGGRLYCFLRDITERKRVERALRESAERLQSHINNSPMAVVAWDDNYRVTQWAGEAEKMFGWSQAETLGKPIMDLHMIHEPDIPLVQQTMATLSDGKSRYVVSANRNITKDGRVIDCVWYNTAIPKQDGSMASIMSQVLDVTEKNRAKKLLEQERLHLEDEVQRRIAELTRANETLEALFRETDDLYQNAPCGYHSVDQDGNIVRMNDTELKLLGYTRNEVIGRKMQELLSPAGQAAFREHFPRFKELGYIHNLEVEYVRKDGAYVPAMLNTSAVRDANGRFVMSRAMMFDMTERHQAARAQLRLNRALKLLSVGNTVLVRAQDEQGLLDSICRMVVEVGGYLMAWVGYAEHDADKTVRPVALSGYEEGYLSNVRISWADSELGRGTTGTAIRTETTQINQNIHSHPGMRPWREAALKRGYQSNISLPIICMGRALGALTIYAVEPDAFVADEITLLEELANNLAYGIETLRVRALKAEAEKELETYRRNLEDLVAQRTAELSAAKIEAERANNAKSRFLAAASHDLRQPLSALKLYVSVLKGKLEDTEPGLMTNMEECVGGLSNLLSKLLDLSKLEAGVVTPHASHFALDAVLNQVLAAHLPEAEAKGLRVRCRCSGLTAYTDGVLFQRIVGNLVSNAIEYTGQGGLLIGTRRRQGKIWVEVWDTGVGIPADKTGEIFEEFKQLGDDARTRGSGLGLTIVAKSASLLGLQIRVQSRLGRGSMFAVELPLGQAAQVKSDEEPAAQVEAARVAVVDDNPVVLHALELVLKAAGNDVVAATSGEEVLDGLGGQRPDIIVSDYRLAAGRTGFDVITALRAAFGADLPGVILTGDIDPKLMAAMTRKGIVILHKPVEMEALLARIEEAKNASSLLRVL